MVNDKYEQVTLITELADNNCYNDQQNIVRIKMGSDKAEYYMDFQLMSKHEVPNPTKHYAIVNTISKYLNFTTDAIPAGSKLLELLPGYDINTRVIESIPFGYVLLVDKEIKNCTTNINDLDMTNFNSSSQMASSKENVRYTFSPTLNKNYTTSIKDISGDINNQNIGIFITDNTVYLKSHGGMIALGDDGIQILGDTSFTSTVSKYGILGKNPMAPLIPETLLTFEVSIKYTIDLDYIAGIGNSVNRTVASIEAAQGAVSVISRLRSVV